jgi:hypothetical protein
VALSEAEVNELFQEVLGRDAGEEGIAAFTAEGQGGTAGVRQSLLSSAELQREDPVGALATGVPQLPAIAPTEVANVDTGPETIADPTEFNIQAPAPVEAAQATAQVVSEDVGQVEGVAPIDATLVEQGAIAEAAEGTAIERDLKTSELVSEQLAELTIGLESGDIPLWAQGAVASVDRQLQKRGLSRSSIGQAELTNVIMQTALPIAQANAQALQRRSEINLGNAQQIAVQNLNNEQQANMLSAQNQQQVLLSDQSAENAATQFNSVSEQQTQQFNAQMKSSIAQNNAARITAVDQFNAGQTNSMAQFNSQMQTQVEQFNSSQASAISQSNVGWRRQANLSDTAATNAANMNDANARNQLTSQDMSNRWQAARDLANWANQSEQNEMDRQTRLLLGAMQSDSASDTAYVNAMSKVVGYGINQAGGVGEVLGEASDFLFGDEDDEGVISDGWAWLQKAFD